MTQQPLLQLRAVCREYPAGEHTLKVLKGVDLDIHAGEFIAIVGASGSGKSTLMNILGCLDRPTSGTYRVAGLSTADMTPDELAELRREHFGFIFQRYHLLADLTALGNVEVPAVYAGVARGARHERARALLSRLGLADRMSHRPNQLSGGQQQRVSIARALMNGGAVILADEPTGALDTRSGEEVLKILGELHAEGHTIIIVTHDRAVAEHAERIIEIRDGEIVADRINSKATRANIAGQERASLRAAQWQALRDRFLEAFRMALLAMAAHRMRTFLTMLGIIIGIASVVS
ncbi:MAG TPA: ATP-binding cassette domain-containing protein, partial [Steroidobacteraceae bacterium]